jgi:transcription elongation factor Elf1
MQTAQIIADAAEDSAIRRYRYLRQRDVTDRRLVQLPCGRCGAVQGVVVQHGMRVVAFGCGSCHQRTTAQVR